MRSYLLLWFTQKVPGLGSAMTVYTLVIWSYTQEGSALQTALLMLFLAAINLVASMYNAAFPAMMLSKASETVMGTVNSVIGITMLIGSVLASFMPAPKSRVKAIWCCLMLSMCTENFFLAFGNSLLIWCFGAALGWVAIPWMNADLEAVNRLNIPIEIQGRVFCSPELFSVLHHLGGLFSWWTAGGSGV